jgi:hypothetical protein
MTDAIVTIRPGASPGERLMALEQELRIKFPHLAAGHARHLVREQNPDLVELDHKGLPAVPAEPTVDPGQLIAADVHKRLADGRAATPGHAQDQIAAEHPDWLQAWASCRMLPASSATSNPAATPARQSADPELAAAYATGTPLPLGSWPTAQETVVKHQLEELQRMQAELAAVKASFASAGRNPNHVAGRVRYNELSPAERARHLPPLRKLAPGEPMATGRTHVAKMGASDVGGGMFVLEDAVV